MIQDVQTLYETGHDKQFGSVQGLKMQAPAEITYPAAQTVHNVELVQFKQFVSEVLHSLQVLMASI